uniref:Defensin-like cystein-rich peptide n=1 Tax=Torenia fournieri TaxID=68875 RepID=B9ZZZ0_9LAMI|nr:defensin-like cystein-rich peptide [Torenia fournieri]
MMSFSKLILLLLLALNPFVASSLFWQGKLLKSFKMMCDVDNYSFKSGVCDQYCVIHFQQDTTSNKVYGICDWHLRHLWQKGDCNCYEKI